MRLHIADHPLIAHKLTVLRDRDTHSATFRQLVDELAEVGFLGMKRDEKTLEVETYANRLPEDLSGRQCFVLDPMLATGHTMVAATKYLFDRGAKDVTCVCLLAAPEGLKVLEDFVGDRADVTVVVASVDERLNEKSYIVPGLGDAGDRLYGIVD